MRVNYFTVAGASLSINLFAQSIIGVTDLRQREGTNSADRDVIRVLPFRHSQPTDNTVPFPSTHHLLSHSIVNRSSSQQYGTYIKSSSLRHNRELLAPQALTSGIQSRYLISKGSRTMSDLTPSN